MPATHELTDGTYRVFVTYGRQMRNVVFPQVFLPESLERHRIEAWVDVAEMDGRRWEESARQGIAQACAHVVVVDQATAKDVEAVRSATKSEGLGPIGKELFWAREQGLDPIYVAVEEFDRTDFVNKVADGPPEENVLCVIADRPHWLGKLVRTIEQTAKFAAPDRYAWAVHRDGGELIYFSLDPGGASGVRTGLPINSSTLGLAMSPTFGRAAVRDRTGSVQLVNLRPDGTIAAPHTVRNLDHDAVPLALVWASKRLRCLASCASGFTVFQRSEGTVDLDVEREEIGVAEAAPFREGFVLVQETGELRGAPPAFAAAAPNGRWFSIDGVDVHRGEALAALERTGARTNIHVFIRDDDGREYQVAEPAHGALSVRLVRERHSTKGRVTVALLTADGPLVTEYDLGENNRA